MIARRERSTTLVKRFVAAALGIVLLVVAIGAALGIHMEIARRQLAEPMASIGSTSDRHKAFIHMNRDGPEEMFDFDISSAREVQIHAWQMNLLGSVSVSIAVVLGGSRSSALTTPPNKISAANSSTIVTLRAAAGPKFV